MAESAQQLVTLGLQYHQSGALAEALQLYRRAVDTDPQAADAWCLLGIVQRAMGQTDEAVTSYIRSLQLNPAGIEARNNLGNAWFSQGKWAEAMEQYKQVLILRPDFVEAHNGLGVCYREAGQLEEAAACYRRALQHRPNYPDALNNLGSVLDALDRREEACEAYREALRLRPDYVEAMTNLGSVLARMDKFDEAVSLHRRALQMRPSFADAQVNLGNAFSTRRQFDAAIDCYREALRLKPDYAKAYYNLGLALAEKGRLHEAVAGYQKAMELQADYTDAQANLGNVFLALGKPAEALTIYDEVLRQKPESPEAHMSRAFALLASGDYEQGWHEYEWRWKAKEFGGRPYDAPLWDGSQLNGQTILLHGEQGLGDTIQFVRYAPLVYKRGGRVVLRAPAALGSLLARLPSIDEVVGADDPPPDDFDCYAPLLSLPGIFHTTIETIPADVPYLSADPDRIEAWRKEFEPLEGFKVGIAWQGSTQHKGDRQRSIPLSLFTPLARLPGVRMFSLQKGPGSEQLAGASFPIVDLSGRLADFHDTAAVVANLDLVITCDTAVGHLAGAMGRPVWIALALAADWRWMLGKSTSPWYPTARLFRQTTWGAWEDVFARLTAALREQVSGHSQRG
jgi:tetratricopeptide (TPR) repeat protein